MVKAKYDEWLTERSLERLKGMSLSGSSRTEIAAVIGISPKTLGQWEKKFPELRAAVRAAENIRDPVEKALLKRAVGYTATEVTRQLNGKTGEFETVKIVEKQVMPSTTAQIFWLKNRCGYQWEEKPDEESGGVVVLPELLDDEEG